MKTSTRALSLQLFLVFLLLWPVGAVADYDAGYQAYERGDYETAMREFLPLAEQGDTDAQNFLGFMYGNGEGVPKDDREAVMWYRRAATQGNAVAQFNLGLQYTKGKGVPEDNREAVKWFRKAAEQGYAFAQHNLGVMYNNGKGIPKDDREAVKWYRRAAEQGYVTAQYRLGVSYAIGKGVPENDHEAVKWYRKAAEQGHTRAQYSLGVMYNNGEGMPEDDREAVKWYRKAAEQGHARAQNNLGVMYNNGEGVPTDYVQAYAWFNLAAAQGIATAAENKDNIEKIMTPSQIAQAQSLSNGLVQRIDANNAVADSARTATEPTTATQPDPSRSLVKEAQGLLARLGYQPGPADGLLGPQTESAVKAFQSALEITPDGVISDELVALLQITAAIVAEESQPSPSPDASRHSSGSGFFVSADGHLVTNHHVIDGCSEVTVTASGTQLDASVLSVDEPNDLALMQAGGGQREPAVLRSSHLAALGEQVTVAGFPLSGLLADDLNVTSGEISALAGPGNNARIIQITAPVQSGNSGGPLLDKSGQVIGVVVSKLNAPEVYRATGELPENINFAVNGALLRSFLDIHRVNYRTGEAEVELSGENVAAKARQFVVLVGCWK